MRLGEARCGCGFWKMSVLGTMLLCLAGCGEGQPAADSGLKDEVEKLRQEVVWLKGEVARQKSDLLEIRRRGDVARAGKPSREEFEAHRKMMQDPEMRKKYEADRKARMEERRRLHEERRREMKERHRNRTATGTAPATVPAAAPTAAPDATPAK